MYLYLYFLVTLTMTTTAEVLCSNGAICLSLQNCPGLYDKLQDLNEKSSLLNTVIRQLHCGYEDNYIAKICCPPGFQDINGLNLLPNSSVCGIQMTDRIYGGVQTGIDEHPWTVLIVYKRVFWISFECGGVLISSRYVLSAAHCFVGEDIIQDEKLFKVRLGEWNLASRKDCQEDDCSPNPLNVDVETITIHENYNPGYGKENDIALVRLDQDLLFTDFVRPICLPIESTFKGKSFEDYDLQTAGWGLTETGLQSSIKLKVNLKVWNTENCKFIYMLQNVKITEKQLCAGGEVNKDSCNGDSGGALMGLLGVTKNWVAIGITSFGPSPCGATEWPGVYTRVTEYIDWILSTIES